MSESQQAANRMKASFTEAEKNTRLNGKADASRPQKDLAPQEEEVCGVCGQTEGNPVHHPKTPIGHPYTPKSKEPRP